LPIRCLKQSEGERQEALKIFNHLAHRRIEEDEATTPQGQQPLQVRLGLARLSRASDVL
jgi:hypothetical protein